LSSSKEKKNKNRRIKEKETGKEREDGGKKN